MEQIIYKGLVFNKPNNIDEITHRGYGKTHTQKRNGELIQLPCEVCGNEDTIAHHEIYGKDPKYRWLCKKHHKIIHALLNEGKYNNESKYYRIQLDLPKEFSYELDQYLLDLKIQGIERQTKAELIIKFARMQFNKEKQ
jgi:hypothetical protein